MRELARFLNKDVKIIHPKIKELEQEGLIELKTGDKNKKRPVLNYDKIEIAI
uniref:HVO_A0114 family putative DNA-binding protein n=1 Tax=Methanobrevibacter cuticularis TaxID=47311 RepID=UPI00373FD27A